MSADLRALIEQLVQVYGWACHVAEDAHEDAGLSTFSVVDRDGLRSLGDALNTLDEQMADIAASDGSTLEGNGVEWLTGHLLTALSAPPVDLRPLMTPLPVDQPTDADITEPAPWVDLRPWVEKLREAVRDMDTDAVAYRIPILRQHARQIGELLCADELEAVLAHLSGARQDEKAQEPVARVDPMGDSTDNPTAASNEPNRAEIIARLAHKGQTDKAGQPYIEHVKRVWWDVPDEDDEAQAAAWLHDVVEDTELSLVDLQTLGFSEAVIDAVDLLTRKPPFDYASYIAAMIDQRGRIGRRAALLVKRSDLRDHLVNPGCPETLRPRYQAALPLVEAAIAVAAVDPQAGDTRG